MATLVNNSTFSLVGAREMLTSETTTKYFSSVTKPEDINKIVLDAEKENAKIITTEKDFLRINKDKNSKIKFVIAELKIKKIDQLKKIILKKNENN